MDNLIECAANLHLAYAAQSDFDEEKTYCIPSLVFIKIALYSGMPKTLRALHAVFPIDRDWIDQADFRGHLMRLNGEETHD